MLKHYMSDRKLPLLSYYEHDLNPLNSLHQVRQVRHRKYKLNAYLVNVKYPKRRHLFQNKSFKMIGHAYKYQSQKLYEYA